SLPRVLPPLFIRQLKCAFNIKVKNRVLIFSFDLERNQGYYRQRRWPAHTAMDGGEKRAGAGSDSRWLDKELRKQ
ncbi:hypothetical protein ACUVNT_003032, partial [Yersinia enterocolitica]